MSLQIKKKEENRKTALQLRRHNLSEVAALRSHRRGVTHRNNSKIVDKIR